MAWVAFCFLSVLVTTSVSATATGAVVTEPGPGDSIQSASCQIKLRGKDLNAGGPDITKDDDYKTSDQGLQEVQLACSTIPAGLEVPISVNRTWISAGHTTGFKVGP